MTIATVPTHTHSAKWDQVGITLINTAIKNSLSRQLQEMEATRTKLLEDYQQETIQ